MMCVVRDGEVESVERRGCTPTGVVVRRHSIAIRYSDRHKSHSQVTIINNLANYVDSQKALSKESSVSYKYTCRRTPRRHGSPHSSIKV